MGRFKELVRWFFPAASLALLSPRVGHAGTAETVEFEGTAYRVYRAQPDEIELHWKDATGQPYAQFSQLQKVLEARGRKVEFLMNAGIFNPGGIPAGLHVEDGVELRPLNLNPGEGNFYLAPNGVFAVANGKAVVRESKEFSMSGLKPSLATQSGPLLLRGGVIHPQFRENSPNRKHRNGVGVNAKGEVVFAITNFEPSTNRVNLHGFARLFQHLGCADALFLDGDVSEMILTPTSPLPAGNRLGAMFAVTSAGSSK